MRTSSAPADQRCVHSLRQPVLVVDDNPLCVQVSVGLLERLGYAPETAVSAEEALRQFDPERHAMVLTDNEMGTLSGMELARILKQRSPTTPVILCTGRPPEKPGVLDAVLPKPLRLNTLRGVLAQVSIAAV